MDEAEFDKFAAEYRDLHAANIRLSGENPEYFAEYKIKDIAAELARANARLDARVLDFGAGVGYSVPFFRRHLPAARITCLDVSKRSLAIGAAKHQDEAEFRHFDGTTIPYDDASFDTALASCVFHHVAPGEHIGLLRELRRVLKPGGQLFVFEHNPLNPLTRRAVSTCEFDENAVLIMAPTMRKRLLAAGFGTARIRYRIFFPAFLSHLRVLERHLTWLPLGAQYYVCASS